MGNRQRLLIDAQAGVYRYDQLVVLKDTGMPAVLLEAGSIINREEELRMGSAEHQTLVSAAVTDAVKSFCRARRPRTPTNAALARRRGARTDKQAALIRLVDSGLVTRSPRQRGRAGTAAHSAPAPSRS